MVMSLHSSGGTSLWQQAVSSFSDDALGDERLVSTQAQVATVTLGQQERFIAVFPQASSAVVPGSTNQWDLRPDGVDVRFLAALTSELHRMGCSRPAATSVNGYSMGAMMSARLVCAAPSLFGGLGMVSGVYPPTPGCRLPTTTSVVGMHGTSDWLVTWSGWVWPNLEALGIESFPYDRAEMVRMWARAKGCDQGVRATYVAIAVDEYVGCAGSTTHMVTFVGGDHTWNTYGVDASRYLWSVLRPGNRNPVHSGSQALMQAFPPPVSGIVAAPDGHSVVSVDAGVPNATVVGTLTVTGGSDRGFSTVAPCDRLSPGVVPGSSNVNFAARQSVASGVVVRTGADGRFCVYSTAPVHVVWDQVAETDLPSHAPDRKVDTRKLFGVGSPPPAGSVVSVDAGVPNSTVVGTLTVTGGSDRGFATAAPCDRLSPGVVPGSSNVNFAANQSVASGVVVRTGADGRFCVYLSAAVHVVWDQVAETDLPSHSPVRKVDTRVVTPSQ